MPLGQVNHLPTQLSPLEKMPQDVPTLKRLRKEKGIQAYFASETIDKRLETMNMFVEG